MITSNKYSSYLDQMKAAIDENMSGTSKQKTYNFPSG